MANEKQPRATATKRATTPRAARATKTNPEVEVKTAEPIATAPAAIATARHPVEVNAQPGPRIDLDAVRRRAYELYVERGRLDGFHEQDWYTAEQELRGRKQSRSQNGGRTGSKRSA